jgi:hypothetical protein
MMIFFIFNGLDLALHQVYSGHLKSFNSTNGNSPLLTCELLHHFDDLLNQLIMGDGNHDQLAPSMEKNNLQNITGERQKINRAAYYKANNQCKEEIRLTAYILCFQFKKSLVTVAFMNLLMTLQRRRCAEKLATS